MGWLGFSRNAWLLISIQSLITLCNALAGIFVNVFLWKIDPRLETLAWYNFWMFGSVMVSAIVAGYVAKRWDCKWALLIGIVAYISFYVLLLILKEQSVEHLSLLGILGGIGLGFVAIAQHVLTYDTTNNELRDRFYSLLGFIGAGTGMLAPLVSGWVITRYSGISGYYIIFAITLGLFLISATIVFFLPRYNLPARLELKEVLRLARVPKNWRAILSIQALLGIRDGLFAFIITILIFSVTKSELGVGQFNLVIASASLVSYFFLSRTIRVQNRMTFALVGAVMVFLATMALSFSQNFWIVLLFNLTLAIFYPFWGIPLGSTTFEVISSLPRGKELRIEFIVAREIPLGLGRLASLSVFLLLGDYISSWTTATYMLRVFSFVLLIGWWLLYRYVARPSST